MRKNVNLASWGDLMKFGAESLGHNENWMYDALTDTMGPMKELHLKYVKLDKLATKDSIMELVLELIIEYMEYNNVRSMYLYET